MITSMVTTNGEGEAMAQFSVGQTIRATTRDHGHLAASRVKSFTGIVTESGEATMSFGPMAGTHYEWIRVKLAPAYTATRRFDTRTDSIEAIG